MEQVHAQLRDFLNGSPSQPSLTDYINRMQPKVTPTLFFDYTQMKGLKELTPVYIHLSVQDIRESFFYYSLVIKRPFTHHYQLMKFGNVSSMNEDLLDDPQYMKVMTDRDQIICTPLPYTTQWVHPHSSYSVQLFVDGKCTFKLGESIHGVAMYCPQSNKLYYVRPCSEDQIMRIDPLKALQFTHDFIQTKDQLLSVMKTFVTDRYAQLLLYSFLSPQPFFLSCDVNLSALVRQLLPRVCNLQVKHPFPQSLFPYQDEESVLHQTPMQLSAEHTYVIIDFSSLSEKEEVRIQGEEIDNIKALKMFVEEGKAVYRWQSGETLIPHTHTGLVVRAANIILPHLTLKEQHSPMQQEHIHGIDPSLMKRFREYIQAARKYNPLLSEEESGRIKEEIDKYLEGKPSHVGTTLEKRMKIAKMGAMAEGSDKITLQHYLQAVKLWQ